MASGAIGEVAPIRALPRHRDRFDYLIPGDLEVAPGDLVHIPFRGRPELGLVLKRKNKSDISNERLDSLIKLIPGSQLTKSQIEFAEWVALEYFTSIGQTLKSFIVQTRLEAPRQQSIQKTKSGRVTRSFDFFQYASLHDRDSRIALTIQRGLGRYSAIACIFPERVLAEQCFAALPADLRQQAVVLHGSLPDRIRVQLRQQIATGQKRIVVGTGTVLFEPLPDSGLIILDDELNQSYKQSDRQPHYHVRDLAQFWYNQRNTSLLFTGVVPSLELADALREHHGHWTRPAKRAAPMIELISSASDAKSARHRVGYILENAIRANLENHQRSLLYLNRLGRAQRYVCADCGWEPMCGACNQPLVPDNTDVRCRYCDWREPAPLACLNCSGSNLRLRGFGLDSVYDELAQLFPTAVIVRVTDTVSADTNALAAANIILATSKCFRVDLPLIHLVGVLSLELETSRTEWWAREMFQYTVRKLASLIPGVAKVLVQTRFPDEHMIRFEDSGEQFIKDELRQRSKYQFPPSAILIKATRTDTGKKALLAATRTYSELAAQSGQFPKLLRVSPPFQTTKQVRSKAHLLIRCSRMMSAHERSVLLDRLGPNWLIDVRPFELE